jgi:uncharacterized protein YutE (UPF0331/DUF86 family)
MIDDVVLNKKESIERCIKQIRTYYLIPSEKSFENDYFKQDAIAANLQRVSELVIDLANHVIKKGKLGLPKETRESFAILSKFEIIPAELSDKLKGMVGFRNIMVHDYQQVDIKIMIDVIERHLDDLITFTNYIMEYNCANPD